MLMLYAYLHSMLSTRVDSCHWLKIIRTCVLSHVALSKEFLCSSRWSCWIAWLIPNWLQFCSCLNLGLWSISFRGPWSSYDSGVHRWLGKYKQYLFSFLQDFVWFLLWHCTPLMMLQSSGSVSSAGSLRDINVSVKSQSQISVQSLIWASTLFLNNLMTATGLLRRTFGHLDI